MIAAAKINDIKEYSISSSELMIVNLNKQLFHGERLVSSDAIMIGSILDGFLIYGEESDYKTRLLNLNSNKVKVVGLYSFFRSSFEGKLLIASELILPKYERTIVKFDFQNQVIHKILFEIPYYKVLWASKSLLVIKNNESFDATSFFLYNHQTETTLWQFDSSELGIEKISKIMGVFGEVLVVVGLYENPDPRYSDQYELFMGFDINTGSLLWQQKEVLINEKTSPLGGLSFNLQFQNDGLMLEALLGEYYWTLNSQSGEITAVSIKDQLDDIGLWVAMSSAISATHLYFRAQVHALGGFAKCIGSFDLETKKIDWFHTFEEFNQTGAAVKNNQPKVGGNKIYALDTNNTLHIFERE
ncbi:hypothetical protein [uncultured Arcticibacterium sp.]|uniref:hypothetical protein n=1 Tax=uncultured Arcticibacterium sp. TaxID=2173042 RepID=UPI0030F86077